MNREEIIELVEGCIRDILSQSGNTDNSIDSATLLLGSKSMLDSLALVSLIVEIEQRLKEENDLSIRIVDERAMSEKNSPFRTVGSLCEYLFAVLNERN